MRLFLRISLVRLFENRDRRHNYFCPGTAKFYSAVLKEWIGIGCDEEEKEPNGWGEEANLYVRQILSAYELA